MRPSGARNAAGVWQADLISLAALVLLVLLVYLVDGFLQPAFTPFTLLIAGVVLAVLPAVIWLAFFYRRDRQEPEPKALVLQVFVLGGLLAAAVGTPLLESVFETQSWLTRSTLTHLLGSVLVVGFTQEFLKYAAVRYSVFGSAEFDEPIDGVVYATAAGLGYAAMLNIAFVVDSGGLDLAAGAIRIVITSLAHASFAGVTGYFLGVEKFQKKPLWWMPAGVALAAVLNGLFFFLRTTIMRGGLSAAGSEVQRWLGFALAALLAAGVTAVLSAAISRQIGASPAGKEAADA